MVSFRWIGTSRLERNPASRVRVALAHFQAQHLENPVQTELGHSYEAGPCRRSERAIAQPLGQPVGSIAGIALPEACAVLDGPAAIVRFVDSDGRRADQGDAQRGVERELAG